jgi:hypothetical protein
VVLVLYNLHAIQVLYHFLGVLEALIPNQSNSFRLQINIHGYLHVSEAVTIQLAHIHGSERLTQFLFISESMLPSALRR